MSRVGRYRVTVVVRETTPEERMKIRGKLAEISVRSLPPNVLRPKPEELELCEAPKSASVPKH